MGKPVILKTIQEMEVLFSEDPDLMYKIVGKAIGTPPGDREKILESHRAYVYHRKRALAKKAAADKILEVPPHKLTV